MLQLVEKIRAVHQRQGQAGNRVLCEQLVYIAAHQVRTAQSAGLRSEENMSELQSPTRRSSDLVEKIRAVHQRQGQAGNRVLCEQLVYIAAHQVRTAQSAGL